MAKAKSETKISPRGTFMFPHLINPDFEFKEEFGEYSVKLRVPSSEAADLMKEIDAAFEANYTAECARANKDLKKKDLPYEVDEETDTVIFAFKKNAAFKDSKTGEVRQVTVGIKTNTKIDGKFQDHPRDVDIWGGTVGRVAFSIYPYLYKGSVGIRLNLNSVKILTLVTGGESDQFGDEDDDYEGEDRVSSDADFDTGDDEAAGDADF